MLFHESEWLFSLEKLGREVYPELVEGGPRGGGVINSKIQNYTIIFIMFIIRNQKLSAMNIRMFFILFVVILGSCSKNNETPEIDTSVPSVQIGTISNITAISAIIDGNVPMQGESAVVEKGICWDVTQNPDINDNRTNEGEGVGSFSSMIQSLETNTEYFVRAYATNSAGTNYSDELTFTTTSGCNQTYVGQLRLRTQQDVIDFGAMNYCAVTNCFYIWYDPNSNTDPIVDLSPLSGLQSVGCLQILGNIELNSLSGLEGITEVGELIAITDNPQITHIDELQNISSLLNIIVIDNNQLLENIDGLGGISGMSNLGGSAPQIYIGSNPALISINGLQGIVLIDGGFITISLNNALQNVNGLSQLPNTLGGLSIYGNPNLSDLSGLSHYTNFNGSLNLWGESISNNSLHDLINLSTVGGSFNIGVSNQTSTLDGLNNLTMVGGQFRIYNQDSLVNLDALSSLVFVGSILFETNGMLTNLDGLINLLEVPGDLEIKRNGNLNDFCGLEPLILANGLGGLYIVEQNGYNPTIQDILNGDCSQ